MQFLVLNTLVCIIYGVSDRSRDLQAVFWGNYQPTKSVNGPFLAMYCSIIRIVSTSRSAMVDYTGGIPRVSFVCSFAAAGDRLA